MTCPLRVDTRVWKFSIPLVGLNIVIRNTSSTRLLSVLVEQFATPARDLIRVSSPVSVGISFSPMIVILTRIVMGFIVVSKVLFVLDSLVAEGTGAIQVVVLRRPVATAKIICSVELLRIFGAVRVGAFSFIGTQSIAHARLLIVRMVGIAVSIDSKVFVRLLGLCRCIVANIAIASLVTVGLFFFKPRVLLTVVSVQIVFIMTLSELVSSADTIAP